MKVQLISILALLAPIMSSAQTQVTAEELAAFDDVQLVKDACIINDKTPSLKIMGEIATGLIGNFKETAKRYSNHNFGHHGIREFVTEDISNKLRVQFILGVKQGCSQAKTEYLRYANLGILADESTTQAFFDGDVRLGNSYVPASSEAIELYRKCAKFDYLRNADGLPVEDAETELAQRISEKVYGYTHKNLIFRDSAIASIFKLGVNKLLLSESPKNCDQIQGIEQFTLNRLMEANRLLIKKILLAGYDLK